MFILSSSTSKLIVEEMRMLFTRSTDDFGMFVITTLNHSCALNFSRCCFTQHSSVQNIGGNQVRTSNETTDGIFLCENCKMSDIFSLASPFYLKLLSFVSIFNCSFINNHCIVNDYDQQKGYLDHGGCISFFSCTLINISSCLFRNCGTFDFGGAFLLYESTVNIMHSLFIGMYSDLIGGSLVFDDGKDVYFFNCSFIHSYGDGQGGAIIFIKYENISMNLVNFYNCSSCRYEYNYYLTNLNESQISGSGGGVFVWNSNRINISSCSFVNSLTLHYGMKEKKKDLFIYFN
jgi:hypothetical protein